METTTRDRFHNFKIEPSDQPLLEQMTALKRDLLTSKEDYASFAARHNVPLGTVKSRIHRARAELMRLRDAAAAPE